MKSARCRAWPPLDVGITSVVAWFSLVCVASALEYGKEVTVSMNKVWPFANPTETYQYYDLPYCQPSVVMPHLMSMGQILRGDRLVNSIYTLKFREEVPRTVVCEKDLRPHQIQMFKDAIDRGYVFELFVGELPIDRPIGLKFVGEEEGSDPRYFLVNYLDFIVGYNGNEVVSANVTKHIGTEEHLFELPVLPGGPTKIEFSYSVAWVNRPEILPSQALEIQLHAAMPHGHMNMDIHWLAILNSFVLMVLILSIFLCVIIRVVRSDLSRYLSMPEEDFNMIEEETGWKLLHADVFRPPKHRLIFCSMVGAGAQLFSMVVMIVLVGCIGSFYKRGRVVSAGAVCYMITAAIAGYYSASLYQKLGGEKWAWNIFVTAIMFAGPAFVIWFFLNTVATIYGSTAAFPFPTILLIFAMWACVTFPLTVLGGIAGRHQSMKQSKIQSPFPCKTNKLAREIPECQWYYSQTTQMCVVGSLPFSAIYIELHYIFNSVWGSRIYTLYGILLLAFTMLLLVAATIAVLFTYFHLNAEDYRWWWRSLLSGASVAACFYLYCFYFFSQSGMHGFMQCSFFFLYSLLLAHGLALMIGSVTFLAVYNFVGFIYSRIKAE